MSADFQVDADGDLVPVAGDFEALREALQRSTHSRPEVIMIPRSTWEKLCALARRGRRQRLRQQARKRKQRRGWR